MAEEKEILCCETEEIHEDLLKIVNETMPDGREMDALAELFKVFGDPTRIRILLSYLRRRSVSVILPRR